MTKYILAALFCCLGLFVKAQDSSDVLMIVAGKFVSSAEFCSDYERNQDAADFSKEQVDDFLPQFINKRLLLAEAEALHLDTLAEFRHKMSLLSSSAANSPVAQSSDWKKVYAGKPCVQIIHFTLPLRQRASYGEQQTLRTRMDSLYNAVLSGSDFMAAASRVASGSVQVEWVGRNQLLADLESVAFRLSEGQMSTPILSTDGFHLMKCLKVGFQEDGLVATPAPAAAMESVAMDDYRSGLLIHLLHDRKVMGNAEEDLSGLKQYFSDNQKKYAWDIPRFKGVVYHCKNKKAQKLVKKLLSKQPQDQWQSLIENPDYSHVFQNVRVSPVSLFILGQNEHVDELAFGGPKAQADGDYPVYGILGKELKKYPDSFEDAGDGLVDDYQNHLERLWMDGLKKRHQVAINEKALKRIYK